VSEWRRHGALAERGFTLREVIVVLAIGGTISAVALPGMGNAPVLVSTQAGLSL